MRICLRKKIVTDGISLRLHKSWLKTEIKKTLLLMYNKTEIDRKWWYFCSKAELYENIFPNPTTSCFFFFLQVSVMSTWVTDSFYRLSLYLQELNFVKISIKINIIIHTSKFCDIAVDSNNVFTSNDKECDARVIWKHKQKDSGKNAYQLTNQKQASFL